MAHRALVQEWNRLVPVALLQGYTRGPHCRVRLFDDWRISRTEAQSRVDWIRMITGNASTPVLRAVMTQDQQTFGVEFEFFMPLGMTRAQLASLLTTAGIPCEAEHWNHNTRGHWKLVTDGSLLDYTRGAEMVSPVLMGEEGINAMKTACDVLHSQGCKIRKSCGFHVHVGARNRQPAFFRNLLRIYSDHERALDGVMAESRRGNSYCRSVNGNLGRETFVSALTTETDLRRNFGSYDMRYHKVNLNAFWRHGTVEFRQHQGTVEARKAEMWVRLCLKMTALADQAQDLARAPDSDLGHLLEQVGATSQEVTYFTRRAAFFANQSQRRLAA